MISGELQCTLEEAISKVKSLHAKPSFMIHTGHITQARWKRPAGGCAPPRCSGQKFPRCLPLQEAGIMYETALRAVDELSGQITCRPSGLNNLGHRWPRLAAFRLLASMARRTQGRGDCRTGGNGNRSTGDQPMTGKKSAKETKPSTVVANDSDDLKGTLKNIGGSRSDHWNNILANQTINGLWLKHSDPETQEKQLSATVAALVGIGPKDELEGMMAAQLIAAHNAAMECYRRAMIDEQTFEGRRENLVQANKLSRTYATLLEALNRHRGKGQQKVTVEHVHVHEGGHAIVGNVESRGGGDRPKSEDQPHARQIAHAPQPAMPSTNAERELVPVAGNAERPLPNARRTIARCSEGE
jgi:hypothetical protein